MSQPKWKLIGKIGDTDPIANGGGLVFEDETGVYCPEMTYFEPFNETTVNEFRILLEHNSAAEWWYDKLQKIADWNGRPLEELQASANGSTMEKALLYEDLIGYHGADEFDSEPMVGTINEARERYHLELDDRNPENIELTKAPGIREASYDRKQVRLPNANTGGYGASVARFGDLVVFAEGNERRLGRVIGRVDYAPPCGDSPAVRNQLVVVGMTASLSSATLRWVRPEDVSECIPQKGKTGGESDPGYQKNWDDRRRFIEFMLSDEFATYTTMELIYWENTGFKTMADYQAYLAKDGRSLPKEK